MTASSRRPLMPEGQYQKPAPPPADPRKDMGQTSLVGGKLHMNINRLHILSNKIRRQRYTVLYVTCLCCYCYPLHNISFNNDIMCQILQMSVSNPPWIDPCHTIFKLKCIVCKLYLLQLLVTKLAILPLVTICNQV